MLSKTLRELFVDELRDAYDAETRLARALPDQIEAVSSEVLAAALDRHLSLTLEHITRLEAVFDMFGESPSRRTCKAVIGVLEEGEELIRHGDAAGIRDVALIASAQKLDHYEMAAYGCLRTWAEQMGQEDARDLLQQTLEENGDADQELTDIALALNLEAIRGADAGRDSEYRPDMPGDFGRSFDDPDEREE